MTLANTIISYTPGKYLPSIITPNFTGQNVLELIQQLGPRKQTLTICDRSGTFTGRYKMEFDPYPEFDPSFNMTYTEVCNDVASRLSATGKNISVMYSGGLDSMNVLVSLLQATDSDRITVVMEQRSIQEYPNFYENYIKPNLKVKELDYYFPLYKPQEDEIVVTGDPSPEVFGIAMMVVAEPDMVFLPWEDYITKKIISEGYSKDKTSFLLTHLHNFHKKCPIQIKTAFEWGWWWNFCMIRPNSRVRFLKYDKKTKEEFSRFSFFYDDPLFSKWSMVNTDRMFKDNIHTYKYPQKVLINDFFPDDEYFKNKTSEYSSGPKYTSDNRFNDKTLINKKLMNDELPLIIDSNFNYIYKSVIEANRDNMIKILQPIDNGEWFYD